MKMIQTQYDGNVERVELCETNIATIVSKAAYVSLSEKNEVEAGEIRVGIKSKGVGKYESVLYVEELRKLALYKIDLHQLVANKIAELDRAL